MSSYDHYFYPSPWGGYIQEVGVDPEPDGWTDRWGVNIADAKAAQQGGDVYVDNDGTLVVVPSPFPNDGTP